MFEKMKEFVRKELVYALDDIGNYDRVMNARAIAYGAVQFCTDAQIAPYEVIDEWWTKQWTMFNKLANGIELTEEEINELKKKEKEED